MEKQLTLSYDSGYPLATFSKREVCEILGVSQSTVWSLEQRGLLKPIPHIRHKRYSAETVRRFIEGKAG